MVLFLLAIKLSSLVEGLNLESKLNPYFNVYTVQTILNFMLSAETEVWQLSNGDNQVINPTLPSNTYAVGIGIYAVDFDFCRKN